MLRALLKPMVVATLCLSAASCAYDTPDLPDAWVNSDGPTPDSLSFRTTHHYWIGYNFQTLDSVVLRTSAPIAEPSDYTGLPEEPVLLKRHEELVVAQIVYLPDNEADSVWLKVANDRQLQGWVHEKELLRKVVPDDPVSKAVRFFSDKGLKVAAGCLIVAMLVWLLIARRTRGLPLVHTRFTASFYPALLCLCVAASATLYGTLRAWRPGDWAEFYFHSTLNPLNSSLPPLAACFVASCWAVLVAALAAADDLRRRLSASDAVAFGASLLGVCIVLHLVFKLAAPSRLSFVLLPLYFVFALIAHARACKSSRLCGACGKEIVCKPAPRTKKHDSPGHEPADEEMLEPLVCPHCGALNRMEESLPPEKLPKKENP